MDVSYKVVLLFIVLIVLIKIFGRKKKKVFERYDEYDEAKDIFYIHLGSWKNSYSIEKQDGIFVFTDKETGELLGFIIFNFTHNKEKFNALYPKYKVN